MTLIPRLWRSPVENKEETANPTYRWNCRIVPSVTPEDETIYLEWKQDTPGWSPGTWAHMRLDLDEAKKIVLDLQEAIIWAYGRK